MRNNGTMLSTIMILAAYLVGSLSAAIITCRLMGLPDPRTQGSNNPGATNVLRVGGKKAAAFTLLGDAIKGVIPVLIAHWMEAPSHILALVALAAFLGHLYPVFFGFRGGKGVATAFGVLIALSWPVGLAVLGTWLLLAKLFKISSLSALIAAVLLPFYMWLLAPQPGFIALAIVLSIMLIWRHRSNIKELIAGTEEKIR
ncbi:MAG: glycerol-3-phosphate 1-O-acyltransferase PlsY [Gammaproteobacteria bacterium]|nr:glycerol-3-phosphate 1-O-acyltransferase PlsY [Gammaproteobacteria bacterium]MCF6259038.1 glycerol-3-phosphate 1-O-acyltransferase PlsY [Gammaproteobacteria bacterium]